VPALVRQPLEPGGVDVVRTDGEPVPAADQLDRGVRPECQAQPGDLGLQRVPGSAGGVVQVVDQYPGRHHVTRAHQQQRQQRTPGGATDVDVAAVVPPSPGDTEYPKPHSCDSPPPSLSPILEKCT
jgi:hypothetical protein